MMRSLIFALGLVLTATAAEATVPPLPADHRHFLGAVPTPEGFDLYWVRRNELVPPVTNRYHRAAVSHDGRLLESTVIFESGAAEPLPAAVATSSRGLLLVFRTNLLLLPLYPPEPTRVRLARIEGDLFVGLNETITLGPGTVHVACGEIECALLSADNAGIRGLFVGHDGTPSTRSFELPGGGIAAAYFASMRLFILRTTGPGTAATLLHRAGHVVWDRELPPQLSSRAPAATDGKRHVILWSRNRRDGTRIEAAIDLWGTTIDESGNASDPRTVAAASTLSGRLLAHNLVWNGFEFVAAVERSNDAVMIRLNEALQQIGESIAIQRPLPLNGTTFVSRAGDRVIVGWLKPSLQIAIYANGKMSGAIDLEPVRRRRAASR